MMLQPESQALIRDFNRRLKAALRSAPNHVRVETAMEIESHVLDVLSRQPSEGLEHEQVAGILARFGSPEEYAAALLVQVPGNDVISLSSGAKEVGMAAVDLVRGTGRLVLAMVRGVAGVGLAIVRYGWKGLRRAAGTAAVLAERSREPGGKAAGWVADRIRAGLRGTGRLVGFIGAVLAQGARLALRWGWAGARQGRRAAYGLADLSAAAWRLGKKAVAWVLRAAGFAALAVVTLLVFGLAGVVALMPDVAGWWVYEFQLQVGYLMDDIRRHTVAGFDLGTRSQFAGTGTLMLGTLLAVGFGLLVAWGAIIWAARRRRQTAAGH